MIINIRGTNGSGKSTIIHRLLASSTTPREIRGAIGFKMPEAYQLKLEGVSRPVYILGPYMGQIGGCDRIRPYDTILNLLNKYKARGHVVFEGVLISDNFGRVGAWLEEQGKEAAVIFMDTPLEVCLKNIEKRTKDAGTKHVQRKFEEIQKVRRWFTEHGKVNVLDASMQNGFDRVLYLLKVG